MFARYLRPGMSLIVAMTVLLGIVYPTDITGISQISIHSKAEGSLLHRGDTLIGSQFDRPELLRSEIFLGPTFCNVAAALQRGRLRRFKSRSPQSRIDRQGQCERESVARRRPATARRFRSNWSRPRRAAWIPISARLPRGTRRRALHGQRNLPVATVQALIVEHATWSAPRHSSAKPKINVLELNLALDAAALMAAENRRNPDELLTELKQREALERRGRLKIFFGASAGVGKTYSMLESARSARAAGVDVVVGYVEPHGRAETERLLEGLEQLPFFEVATVASRAANSISTQRSNARRPSCWSMNWRIPTWSRAIQNLATPSDGRTSRS